MNSEKHLELKGTHAVFGASQWSWINYEPEKMVQSYFNKRASEMGTILHGLACDLINEGIKLNKSDTHMVLHELLKHKIPRESIDMDRIMPNMINYIRDALGFRMEAERVIYVSPEFYGTADAIIFRDGTLRIHDLKTGVNPVRFEQLFIYMAFWCIENDIKPSDIKSELRIYQNGEILVCEPAVEDIVPIIDKVTVFNKWVEMRKSEESR